MEAKGKIVSAVSLTILVILVPIVIDAITSTNATNWSLAVGAGGFTGGEGARTLFYLIPFAWIAGLVVGVVYEQIRA